MKGPIISSSIEKRSPQIDHSLLVSLEDVSVKFNQFFALEEINLDIKNGDFIFLLGHSGAGKTTLLNLLYGNLHPYNGKLTFPKCDNLFKAFIHQEIHLMNNMTCFENLMLSYDRKIHDKGLFKNELKELSRILGIHYKLKEKAEKLSGGEKQKLSIIRTLLSHPNLLLADEPSSFLDPVSTENLYDILNYYHEKLNQTIIWATHDCHFVETKSWHSTILIKQGRLFKAN